MIIVFNNKFKTILIKEKGRILVNTEFVSIRNYLLYKMNAMNRPKCLNDHFIAIIFHTYIGFSAIKYILI